MKTTIFLSFLVAFLPRFCCAQTETNWFALKEPPYTIYLPYSNIIIPEYVITDYGKTQLDAFVKFMVDHPELVLVEINGKLGSEKENEILKKRLEVLLAYLELRDEGIANKIVIRGIARCLPVGGGRQESKPVETSTSRNSFRFSLAAVRPLP